MNVFTFRIKDRNNQLDSAGQTAGFWWLTCTLKIHIHSYPQQLKIKAACFTKSYTLQSSSQMPLIKNKFVPQNSPFKIRNWYLKSVT